MLQQWDLRHDGYEAGCSLFTRGSEQVSSDLDENHWKVVKTTLKYLKNTKNQQLIYGDTNLKLVGYIDSNFQSDSDDSRSMLGYVFILNGGAMY